MLPIYLGCLIVGMGLIALSFVGGHDADADVDVDADVDADVGGDVSGADALWLPLLSFRFWVFGAAFFGLTGTLLHFQVADETAVLLASLGLGLGLGFAASTIISRLRATEVHGNIEPDTDYPGRRGVVLLRVAPGDPGQVRLHVKGVDVDLPAEVEAGTLEPGAQVVVRGYARGTLSVAPAEPAEQGQAQA